MDSKTLAKVTNWLKEPFDLQTRQTVQKLIDTDPTELENSFYKDLSFGTGGLRGIVGVGTNRMNSYTVRRTTQGLATYLLKVFHTHTPLSVVISFDNRWHSQEFAQEAATVLIQNGIDVYLCEQMRPTPFTSFACRYKKATAAIMITASHNPKEYNGYKVYWQDGGQVVPPHDEGIIQEINTILDFSTLTTQTTGTIYPLNVEMDNAYLQAIRPLQNFPKENREFGHKISIVYTSLHGTGITLAPKALKDWGFSSLSLVAKQVIPDGNFSTVILPNPEHLEALQLGLNQMKELSADILFATDPDADRLGIAVWHNGNPVILNGNQTAALCTEYLCLQHKALKNPAIVTTIVSTDLIQAICQSYNIACYRTLTGFKYIGELIHLWEKNPKTSPFFLFGAEESYGYLYGTHARDKDAIVSCCLLAEIALYYKIQGKTLIDFLYDIYRKYGIFREKTLALDFSPGKEGILEIQSFMHRLRASPPLEINGICIVKTEDYLLGSKGLPPSDVLAFYLEDKSKILIRPSGTEPKLKIYASLQLPSFSTPEEGLALADQNLDALLTQCKKTLYHSTNALLFHQGIN